MDTGTNARLWQLTPVLGAHSLYLFFRDAKGASLLCREGYLHSDVLTHKSISNPIDWRSDDYLVFPLTFQAIAKQYGAVYVPSRVRGPNDPLASAGSILCYGIGGTDDRLSFREAHEGARKD
jgi:hypothetical protein